MVGLFDVIVPLRQRMTTPGDFTSGPDFLYRSGISFYVESFLGRTFVGPGLPARTLR